MDRNSETYKTFCAILEEELVLAQGCTEPISVAFCAVRAREILGELPEKIRIQASGSIIKNVKSVIVPNTGRLKGLEASAAAGVIAGDSSKKLECIASATEEQTKQMKEFLDKCEITVEPLYDGATFDMILTLTKGDHTSRVRITHDHTNIVLEEKDGEVLLEKEFDKDDEQYETDRSVLSIQSIWDFITTFNIPDLKKLFDWQIGHNMSIAEEGLANDWGANIGSTILKHRGDKDVRFRAKAYAAAGSDARMNGCEMPVVCNSGSGNQGMTVSNPVVVYAMDMDAPDEKMYRALALSNLVAIHQKDGIGRLSAYCGAVSAAAGAGAGIAYLKTESYDAVIHALVTTLAVTSGMVCDGAKASCAAKIATSLDMALLSLDLYEDGNSFFAGDGLVTEDVEDFINNIARLGKEGMQDTNKNIIDMMVGV